MACPINPSKIYAASAGGSLAFRTYLPNKTDRSRSSPNTQVQEVQIARLFIVAYSQSTNWQTTAHEQYKYIIFSFDDLSQAALSNNSFKV